MTETEISLERKLKILADAAKYDVACTSSGSSRRGKKGYLGNTVSGPLLPRRRFVSWLWSFIGGII